MKLELIKKNKQKLLVDFNKFKSVMSLKNDLKTKWGFNPDQINKTLNKYSGQLFMYSPEHAAIMFELLERHLKPMSKHERSGYIASKKLNYIRLGDSNAPEFLFTCAFNFLLAGTIYVSLSFDLKFIICYFIIVFGLITCFLKSTTKPTFYKEILTAIENSLSTDFCN